MVLMVAAFVAIAVWMSRAGPAGTGVSVPPRTQSRPAASLSARGVDADHATSHVGSGAAAAALKRVTPSASTPQGVLTPPRPAVDPEIPAPVRPATPEQSRRDHAVIPAALQGPEPATPRPSIDVFTPIEPGARLVPFASAAAVGKRDAKPERTPRAAESPPANIAAPVLGHPVRSGPSRMAGCPLPAHRRLAPRRLAAIRRRLCRERRRFWPTRPSH